MDKELLHKIALEYINEEISMRVLADRYHLTSATVVRYLSGKQKIHLDEKMQQVVNRTKADRWLEGKCTRGNLGHTKISTEKARELATRMVDEGLTLSDLYVEGGPSVSTIYYSFTEDNLGSELYSRVVKNFEKNKSEATRNCFVNNGLSSSKARK